ncbi:hypothetical protein J2853_005538 [Streptosporangium lutulentum]|uniref:Uncharacterized protein n=1 Tax=Streptosporangium lutulentum TaxID=1461250 RepID=A0ABT9QHT8_9ACTN|nr:hypothetical protein [Streptosporangium lutulentum]
MEYGLQRMTAPVVLPPALKVPVRTGSGRR